MASIASRLLQLQDHQFQEQLDSYMIADIKRVAASALVQAKMDEIDAADEQLAAEPSEARVPDRDDLVRPASLVIDGFAWDKRGLEVYFADGSRRLYRKFPQAEWERLKLTPTVGDPWVRYLNLTYESEVIL